MTPAVAVPPDLWLTVYRLSLPPGLDERAVRQRVTGSLHQVSMSLFGASITEYGRTEKNILWRLERDDDSRWRLVIQSTVPPTEESAALPHIQVKPVSGLFASLTEGTQVSYCTDLSPHQRYNARRTEGGRDRKDVLLTSEQSIKQWVERSGPRAGLRIDPDTMLVQRMGKHPGPKITAASAFLTDRFTGTAVVTDPESLRSTIRKGIGKRRSYGCGLLSVVPAHG